MLIEPAETTAARARMAKEARIVARRECGVVETKRWEMERGERNERSTTTEA